MRRERRWSLYWRWLRVKRAKVSRSIRLELPAFACWTEQVTGDNFPVLATSPSMRTQSI